MFSTQLLTLNYLLYSPSDVVPQFHLVCLVSKRYKIFCHDAINTESWSLIPPLKKAPSF